MVHSNLRRLTVLSVCAVASSLLIAPVPAAAASVNRGSARWIWYPEGDPAVAAPVATRFLRRSFTAPAGPYRMRRLW
jgi:alpha-L-rhamnosidase